MDFLPVKNPMKDRSFLWEADWLSAVEGLVSTVAMVVDNLNAHWEVA